MPRSRGAGLGDALRSPVRANPKQSLLSTRGLPWALVFGAQGQSLTSVASLLLKAGPLTHGQAHLEIRAFCTLSLCVLVPVSIIWGLSLNPCNLVRKPDIKCLGEKFNIGYRKSPYVLLLGENESQQERPISVRFARQDTGKDQSLLLASSNPVPLSWLVRNLQISVVLS